MHLNLNVDVFARCLVASETIHPLRCFSHFLLLLAGLMSSSPPPWPIQSELPAELTFLANPISSYFDAKPPYNKASLGVLIFTPSPHPPNLLLVQVYLTADPHAFSCVWEAPTGSPMAEDLTMLHSLARITFAQTGLHLSRVHTMSGSQVGPGTIESGNAQWMKLHFTVQVSELETDPSDQSYLGPKHSDSIHDGMKLEATTAGAKDLNSVPVLLDPTKHQKHAWVTESDLQEFVNSGLFPTEETKQYQSMLDAFSLQRQDAPSISNDLLPSPTLSQAPSSSSDSPAIVPARADPFSESPKRSVKVEKKSPKKRGTKADKTRPDASHFHRFRIS